MMIERQLENDVAEAIKGLQNLDGAYVTTSRGGKKEEPNSGTVVAVACGFRQNDAFSLTPITMNVAVTIMTRIEKDTKSEIHDGIVESIANLISLWHKDGATMETALSSNQFLAGELRMDGGSARVLDNMNKTWSDTIRFSIRGSEKFPVPDTTNE